MMVSTQPNAGSELKDQRLESWYRATDRSEPRAEVDHAILAAARREVRARPVISGGILRRWRVPVAVAAVVVLSVTVVRLVGEHGAQESVQQPSPPPGRADRAPAAPTPTEEQERRAETSAPRTGLAGTSKRSGADLGQAPAVPAPPLSASRAAKQLNGRGSAAALPRSGDDASQGVTAESWRSESYVEGADAPAAPGRAGASHPAPPPAARALRSPSADSAKREQRRAEPAEATPRQGFSSMEETVLMIKGLEGQPPERWLEKIEELRRRGQVAQADELLAAFKRSFPGYSLAAPR